MYTAVVRQAQLAEGAAITASVQGVELLLACVGGQYFAVAARCSHAGQSLARGRLDNFEIMCPAHGARFDIRTGHCTAAPASQALQRFPVMVEGGKVWVDVEGVAPTRTPSSDQLSW